MIDCGIGPGGGVGLIGCVARLESAKASALTVTALLITGCSPSLLYQSQTPNKHHSMGTAIHDAQCSLPSVALTLIGWPWWWE